MINYKYARTITELLGVIIISSIVVVLLTTFTFTYNKNKIIIEHYNIILRESSIIINFIEDNFEFKEIDFNDNIETTKILYEDISLVLEKSNNTIYLNKNGANSFAPSNKIVQLKDVSIKVIENNLHLNFSMSIEDLTHKFEVIYFIKS